MAGGNTSSAKLKIGQRRATVLELRKQGGTFREIAASIASMPEYSPDYDESLAYDDVMSELKRLNARRDEGAEQVRRLELERLDALLAVLWPLAAPVDRAPDQFAVDRVLAIMARRARYLGLDAPTEITGKGGVPLAPGVVVVMLDNDRGDRASGPTRTAEPVSEK
jgi:hypothetical protein